MITPNPKTEAPAPKCYLRRNIYASKDSPYRNWESSFWPKCLTITNWAQAETQIAVWNKETKQVGMGVSGWEYKLPLHCEKCYKVVSETFTVANLCGECQMKAPIKLKQFSFTGKLLEEGKTSSKTVTVGTPHKEGDIWALAKASAPMGSQQWAYQGSAKTPYIVTSYTTKRDGATTPNGWACSCPNFTRNVPRTPCKHILNVMLSIGTNVPQASAKLANVDDKKLAEFEKWQREQAALKKGASKPTAGAKLNLFGTTTRKFR